MGGRKSEWRRERPGGRCSDDGKGRKARGELLCFQKDGVRPGQGDRGDTRKESRRSWRSCGGAGEGFGGHGKSRERCTTVKYDSVWTRRRDSNTAPRLPACATWGNLPNLLVPPVP